MALLFPLGLRISNATGAPISGGKVRVRLANVATLADLFSDAALTVPLSNPVVCDSAGYPSTNGGAGSPTAVYSADGNFDIAFLSASDSVLVTFEDIPSLGADSATLVKDFTNSRFQVRGSGGTVHIEVGDPDPDASGGTGRLGGWNGSQADEIEIDAAVVSVGTSAGALTENGKPISAVVITEKTDFSAAAEVLVSLPESIPGIRKFVVEFFDLTLGATAGNLQAQLGYEGGAVKSGASDYLATGYRDAGISVAGGSDIDIAVSGETTTNRRGHVTITIVTPDSGAFETLIRSVSHMLIDTAATVEEQRMVGYGVGGYGRCTSLRFWLNGSTISGSYRVVGERGFGE